MQESIVSPSETGSFLRIPNGTVAKQGFLLIVDYYVGILGDNESKRNG